MPCLKARQAKRVRRSRHWTLSQLEQRLLLAGDAGAAVSGGVAIATETALPLQSPSLENAVTPIQLVFVDSKVDDIDAWVNAIESPMEIVLLHESESGIEQISRVLAGRANINGIHLIGHGHAGAIHLGSSPVDEVSLNNHQSQLKQWSQALTADADILLYGCETAAGSEGASFLARLAHLTGADVAASIDVTGNQNRGGDWELERTIGFIETPLAVNSAFREAYSATLPIIIRAAGSTNEEQMLLQIDGQTVATYNNVGGDADAEQYVTFTYAADGISADRVRVQFANDLYEPANGIDRNLRVDSITIDGVTFQTEDLSVFSTGVWLPEDGIEPGYRQSEYLASNGYFQYAGGAIGDETLIEISASGDEGTETFNLQIDGQTVATYNVTTSVATYQFRSAAAVNASQVRVQFINDDYRPELGIDANLNVDSISINSVKYETEAPTVFSTGVWKEEDGIAPGFRQAETLATNGYFQYDSETTGGNAGVIGLATSVIEVDESTGTIAIAVNRTSGSDGMVTVDYQTFDGTATAGADYLGQQGTLTFANGQTTATVLVPILSDTLTEGNESFSFAIDNVQGGATLLAPRTATITLRDDDLPNYSSFANASSLKLNGNASINGSALRLTEAVGNNVGSAFFTAPLPVSDTTSFITAFEFRMTGGNGTLGADGLTFAIQNSPAGASAIGTAGGQLGIGGVLNSVAIEFDTYLNGGDPNDNSVAIIVNGNTAAAIDTRSAGVDLNSGEVRYALIEYNGFTNRLDVFVSGTGIQPSTPVVSAMVDLQAFVGNQAYVGFTAATGGLANVHEVLNWEFTTDIPEVNEPPIGDTLLTQVVATGLAQPTSLDWSPDGRNLYIAQQSGIVRVMRDGVMQLTPTLDFRDHVNGTRDRGLLDIAVHPDLQNNPYLYLLYTYDPPETLQNQGNLLAKPDGNGNRAARMTRVTLDAATNFTTIVAGSEVVLMGTNSTWTNFNGFINSTFDFNAPPSGILPDGTNVRDFIATDSESHTIGSIEFGTDGALYVSIGDGTSYNRVDPRTVRVQDIDNLSGKILRVDPITGAGLPDNPFYNGDAGANRSKVYQYGVRNPFRIALDSETNQLYVGDVGWTAWEEINSAGPGANFGWPYYEGGSGVSNQTGGYKDLAAAQAFYASGAAVTPSLFALNHAATGINAIVLGDVYRGTVYPAEYSGDLFFNDLGQGIVRNISFDASGAIASVDTFTTGAQVVVQIATGPDGNLYFVDLDDGTIGRWVFV